MPRTNYTMAALNKARPNKALNRPPNVGTTRYTAWDTTRINLEGHPRWPWASHCSHVKQCNQLGKIAAALCFVDGKLAQHTHYDAASRMQAFGLPGHS